MSKRRRNHHIPRFLLNRFASRARGDKHWVLQISRDAGAQEVSTRDVAVSGGFYGDRSAGVEDALAAVEHRFATALASIDEGHPPELFADDLSQFAWTMAARTRAIRDQFAAVVDALMGQFRAWSNTPAPLQLLRTPLFDEELRKAIQRLPAQNRSQAAVAIGDPAVRQLVREYAEANFSHWAGTLIDMVQSRGLISTSLKAGQVSGLAKVLNAGAAPESFRPAAWHLVSCGNGHFILGDSCVVAVAEDGSLGPLVKAGGKGWREIYLPISPRQVLVGTRGQSGPSLDSAAINRASAKFALRYVYAACTGPEIEGLHAIIGAGNPLVSQRELEEIVTRAFAP